MLAPPFDEQLTVCFYLQDSSRQIRLHILRTPLITLSPSPLTRIGVLEKLLFEAIATV
jgi:hypothetical protein